MTEAKVLVLVAAPAFAPASSSVWVSPFGPTPTIVNVRPVSSPVLVIVTKRGGVMVLSTRVRKPAAPNVSAVAR